MKTLVLSLMVLGVVGVSGNARAQDSGIPDLTGVWPCDDTHALIRGEWTEGATRTLEVFEQRGATFRGVIAWSLDREQGVAGEVRGELIFSGETPIVGVIGWDNETIYVVSHDVDRHAHHYRLADANTLEVVMTEAGEHAWVGRTICRRQN